MSPVNDLLISKPGQDKADQETPPYEPSPEELSIISTVKKRYEEKELTKRAYEKTWFINGSFIRGHHYVSYNDASKTFEVPYRVPQHRVRLVINYILAYYRRTRARLTAHKPALFTRPATTDQEDVERARLDQKVLDSELYRLDHQAKLKGSVGWMLECGTGLRYLSWNPWAGAPLFEDRPVTDPYTGQQVVDPETGEPQVERVPLTDESGRQLHEGENELEVVSPYEITVDSFATDENDAEWIMRSKIRSLTWIRDHYPEIGKFVKKEDVHLHDFYQKRIRQMVGIQGFANDMESSAESGSSDGPGAVVHEYWERKCAKYPRGRLVVVANNVVLFSGENPYDHQMLPFEKIDEVKVSGRFWGMAMVEQGIPLQRNLNRARSQEVENRTLMGRPKWLVPRTAKVRQGSFDSEAGEKIDYTPGPRGEEPRVIHPPPTHQSTQIEIQHTLNDMQEIFSWHEVSRGILPSANIPGVAVDKLQQADDTSMGDTAANIDNGLTRMGRMLLSNCAQFWKEDRLVRAGGESSRIEAMKIRGEDLKGKQENADYFDVRCIPGSTLVRDPGMQRKMVEDLIKLGVLDPMLHRDVILKIVDVAEIETAFEDDRLDEQWAERENELMEQGEFSLPRDFENHDIHLKVLDRFRKSERYRRLPPHIKELYDNHAAMHKQVAVQVGQERMLIQTAIQGAAMMDEQGQGKEPAAAAQGGEGDMSRSE
jgi:hypothetical protein